MQTQTQNNLHITAPDVISDVVAFHNKFGVVMPSKPRFDDVALTFRLKFLREELQELVDAIEARDLVKVADALTDITYVAVGGMLQLGIPAGLCWDEVQRSNMDKVHDDSGQEWKHCKKPEGWVPPRIEEVLELAGWKEAQ